MAVLDRQGIPKSLLQEKTDRRVVTIDTEPDDDGSATAGRWRSKRHDDESQDNEMSECEIVWTDDGPPPPKTKRNIRKLCVSGTEHRTGLLTYYRR